MRDLILVALGVFAGQVPHVALWAKAKIAAAKAKVVAEVAKKI